MHYTTRISTRAKRLQIRVSPQAEVAVVVPKGFDISKVPAFVAEHHEWIKRSQQRMQRHTQTTEGLLPQSIKLPALGEHWIVKYLEGDRARTVAKTRGEFVLHVYGKDESQQHVALVKWLHGHAKASLVPWLREVSEELGLPFARATVRAQKTRWGSCSSKKNININRNLVFLEPEVVRYLFVHELCHTVHLNHSARYWSLVEKHEPDFNSLDRSLRKAMLKVPRWALP